MKTIESNTIYIDKREPKNIYKPLIEDYGINVKFEFLDIGDIVFNSTCIERKTVSGIIQDSISNRLWEQAYNMINGFKQNIIVIDNIDYINPKHRAIYLGTIARLWNSFKIPVYSFTTTRELCGFIAYLFIQKITRTKKYFTLPTRRTESIEEIQEAILCQIKGIGLRKAKLLLSKYGTLKNIASLSIEELVKNKGISREIAKNIYNVFNREWNMDEKYGK